MPRQPKLMNFARMRGIIEPHLTSVGDCLFIDQSMAVVYGNPQVFRLVLQQNPPFSIDDHRLGMVVRGEIVANINFVEKRLSAGTLLFLGPGTIISPVSISPELEIYGVGLSSEFRMPFAPGAMPQAFNGHVRDFQLSASEADAATARRIIDALWHLVSQPGYSRPTAAMLVGALMHHYDHLYGRHAASVLSAQPRELALFDRFISLVGKHCREEHHMGYYARRMCLTERYLGTVVRQASGTTGKEWIDRALVTHAKVELRHTEKPVAQIAEELNFANPSFFSKYFHRMTGQTPAEFRRA